MAKFIVEGGYPLVGTAKVSGAKNAALPILAASLICRGQIRLRGCPRLRDVDNMLTILADLGVCCAWEPNGGLTLDTADGVEYVMPQRISKELRSSIFMLGPLLARCGKAVCTYPGGCEIGNRPIDLHLSGLSALGVQIREERGLILCDGSAMRGADIHLDYPSVGATENIMMAAVAAKGTTYIRNAAREPETEDLQAFLNALGCDVSGAGTSSVRVNGGLPPKAYVQYDIMPDRIVAGTLLCGAAMTGGEITLNNVVPQHVGSMLSKLREAGCVIACGEKSVALRAPKRLGEIKMIETLPYPGFPTDMQAQFFSLATIADGICVIVENVFENRFKHGPELTRMGAIYTQKDRTTVIRGVKELTGAQVVARDLRGGAALTLAGLAATGITTIHEAELIDRGYERLDAMLCGLGAHVTREV
ncbi:MAG: UDP-N-acetylglucosamine 1-carboxyvinyltransferase [Christensenellaceae bacterium]|jgi:UDP-N-acetylglucosamine 1-carboxyvinyltransferase|nr:UDP-N-acetylglucosamine 1-carboxyvinyltransferase [Christensenellaceae bacterium]